MVVEAKLDKGQGPVATAIVKQGSLAVGQYVVVGNQWGKVRSLHTAAGTTIKQALPGQPVQIAGLKGVPQAGDQLQVLPTYATPPNLPFCISDLSYALQCTALALVRLSVTCLTQRMNMAHQSDLQNFHNVLHLAGQHVNKSHPVL